MKVFKFIATILVLCLVTGTLGVGVYALLKPNVGVLNNASFISGDENVFVKIEGSYSGPELTNDGNETYSYTLDINNEQSYDSGPVQLDSWNIGNTDFVARENEVITITFEFTNLNTERSLKLSFKDIAVDYENKFETCYVVASTERGLRESSKTKLSVQNSTITTSEIPNNITTIEKNQILYVQLIYTLKSYEKSFSGVKNNIKITMETI